FDRPTALYPFRSRVLAGARSADDSLRHRHISWCVPALPRPTVDRALRAAVVRRIARRLDGLPALFSKRAADRLRLCALPDPTSQFASAGTAAFPVAAWRAALAAAHSGFNLETD